MELAEWDEKLGLWHIYTRPKTNGDDNTPLAQRKHYISKILFSGVGQLCVPNACNIRGSESFDGPIFHSARWDHSVSLENKNVFVVGNGCSATQFVPIIAKEAKSVRQAVRSKHWYAKRPHDFFDIRIWRWLLKYVPGLWKFQRLVIAVFLELHMIMMYRNKIGTFFRNRFAQSCIRYAKSTAPAKYHKAIIPDPNELQPGCKRRVFDTDYLSSLKRDNVDIITSPTKEIRKNSVITSDGKEHPADVIVLANGFAITDVGFPMKVGTL